MRSIRTLSDPGMISPPIDYIFSPVKASSPKLINSMLPPSNGSSPGRNSHGPMGEESPSIPIGGLPRAPSSGCGTASSREGRYEGRRRKWILDTEREKEEKAREKEVEDEERAIREENERMMDEIKHGHGHLMEENKEFFFNSPKYILYAIRTYCLSKPVHQFKDLFMQYDENSDGTLDVQEIHHGICRMGFNVDADTAMEIMRMIDLDGDSKLDFAEFRCAILDERIARDFEEHENRMHNECRLQEEYRERCLTEPYRTSMVGPAAKPIPSEGYMYHKKILDKQLAGLEPKLSTRQRAMGEMEAKRDLLMADMAEKRKMDALRHGEKDSAAKQEFMTNLEDKFKNLRAAFTRMDADRSGFLDQEEMEKVCVELNLPNSWTKALIKDADNDGDGQISYVEFVKALERKSKLGKVDVEGEHSSEEDEEVNTKEMGWGENRNILPAVMGNFNYRPGEPVPTALPLAGGWDFQTRKKKSKNPRLFSAHASHMNTPVSQVMQDGVTQCCVRPLSYTVKAKAPDFLK